MPTYPLSLQNNQYRLKSDLGAHAYSFKTETTNTNLCQSHPTLDFKSKIKKKNDIDFSFSMQPSHICTAQDYARLLSSHFMFHNTLHSILLFPGYLWLLHALRYDATKIVSNYMGLKMQAKRGKPLKAMVMRDVSKLALTLCGTSISPHKHFDPTLHYDQLICRRTAFYSLSPWRYIIKRHISWELNHWSLILDLTPGFNGLGEDHCKTRWESFKFWDLVRLRFYSDFYSVTSNHMLQVKFMGDSREIALGRMPPQNTIALRQCKPLPELMLNQIYIALWRH